MFFPFAILFMVLLVFRFVITYALSNPLYCMTGGPSSEQLILLSVTA